MHRSSHKSRETAMFLSIFLGFLGGQQFYLGRPGLGILSILFAFTYIPFIIGIVHAVKFYNMSDAAFDAVYNREYTPKTSKYMHHRQSTTRINPRHQPVQTTPGFGTDSRKHAEAQKPGFDLNISRYRTEGVKHFRNSEIPEAIQSFKKALHFHYEDAITHFNLGACYSMQEQSRKAFFHLSKAVEFGFDDFDRIESHGALEFLRRHDEFEAFKMDGYLLPGHRTPQKNEDLLAQLEKEQSKRLLEQIAALGQLKDEGLLTAAEFEKEKERLRRRAQSSANRENNKTSND